jgi:hypothetical protein
VSCCHHVDAVRTEGFPASAACDEAEAVTSASYAYKGRETSGRSPAEQEETQVVARLVEIHAESAPTYGSPRVTSGLRCRP